MSEWTQKLLDLAAESTSKFDLSSIVDVGHETFARVLGQLSDADRTQVRAWAGAVRDIRAHASWSTAEKTQHVRDLDSGGTAVKLVHALLDTVTEHAPLGQRQVLKFGFTGAMAAARLNLPLTAAVNLAMNAALPGFLLSEHGAKFCDLILSRTDVMRAKDVTGATPALES